MQSSRYGLVHIGVSLIQLPLYQVGSIVYLDNNFGLSS